MFNRTAPSFTLVSLLVVLCASCIGQQAVNTAHLQGEVAFEDTDVFSFVSASEDSVTVYNPQDTLLFTTYTHGGSIKFLRRGRGQYEVINPLGFSRCGDDLIVVDHAGISSPNKLITINLRSPEDHSSWTVDDLSWMGATRPICSIVRLSPTTYLTTGGMYSSGTALSLLDVRNKEFSPIDYRVPMITDSDLLAQEAILSLSSITAPLHPKSLFGYSCGEGKYLDIIELNGNYSVKNHTVALNTPPRFEGDSRLIYSMQDRTNRGIKVKSTQGHLFVFYNQPAELEGYKGYPPYYNDYLDVFTWDGAFVIRLVLDTPFADFIISQDEDVLYSSSMDPESSLPIIKRYRMGTLLRAGKVGLFII